MAPKNGKEILTWTRSMDDALVNAFMHEFDQGNKVNGTFTPKAYENIVNELSTLFGKKIDKDKVKNRWKTLKTKFSEFYDVFKNGMSGFAWNPSTQLWDAEPEVWNALIESKPKAAYCRNTPIPNYEKMVILYGNDRATGEEAETASEMRKRGHSTNGFEFIDSIDELDDRIHRNEVTLENFDDYAFNGTENVSTHEMQSQDPSPTASCGSKRKKSKVIASKEKSDEILEIKGAMQEVAEALKDGTTAIREGNDIMREHHNLKLPPISGEEVWKLIKECGCDASLLPMIFCSLMQDTDKIRTILQCPVEARKDVIMHMVLGSSNPPPN